MKLLFEELEYDKVLKDLIAINIRQRGVGNPTPIKLSRCIKELEKIYGIREIQLANQLGIARQTLQNYKKLTELVPEISEIIIE